MRQSGSNWRNLGSPLHSSNTINKLRAAATAIADRNRILDPGRGLAAVDEPLRWFSDRVDVAICSAARVGQRGTRLEAVLKHGNCTASTRHALLDALVSRTSVSSPDQLAPRRADPFIQASQFSQRVISLTEERVHSVRGNNFDGGAEVPRPEVL